MEYIYKEVNFTKYCPLCEEADTHEEKDPCNECLGVPMNEHSEKPVYFKPKKEIINIKEETIYGNQRFTRSENSQSFGGN